MDRDPHSVVAQMVVVGARLLGSHPMRARAMGGEVSAVQHVKSVDISPENVERHAAIIDGGRFTPPDESANTRMLRALRTELTARAVQVDALRTILLEVTNCLADNTAMCKDLHHAKADQHEGHMDCPVEQRIVAVEARARTILAKGEI